MHYKADFNKENETSVETEEVKATEQTQTAEAEAKAEETEAKQETTTQEEADNTAEASFEDKENTEVEAEVVEEPKIDLASEVSDKGFVSEKAISYLEDTIKALKENALTEEEQKTLVAQLKVLVAKQYEQVKTILTTDLDRDTQRLAGAKYMLEEEKRRLERAKRDSNNAKDFANEKIVKDAIKPLFSNLNLAISRLPKDSNHQDFDQFTGNLVSFEAEFKKALEAHGIKIYGQVGDKFDPNIHDAVAQYPYQTPEQAGTVAHIVSQGYELNGRVVSPASVVAYQED
ncbi:nucleotide exchange factor GrpE [Psittacicella hinzii]|uniref:Protein GrpE n=1 Tax=Psittacicella hinzii TaxID=2028575 RepID=A0A3A1Y1B0_9GAMM|nr:nucleotide exchange factor GrpE [Psittacicella hinzii]RIY31365.1 nucleotide exchange factor GrpE [Psittacicella hinzii]